MPEVVVVGAGLAGLVAAINCARAGHEVRVLEKYKTVGGSPEVHPSVDSTPMRPDKLGEFTGVELKPPHVTPTALMRSHAFGRTYELDGSGQHLQAVERSSRSTSIESYLHDVAKAVGVKFEFGWMLKTQADLAGLPPGTIIATGLHFEPFLAAGVPFRHVFGFVSTMRYEGAPTALAWFGDDTRDYCYVTNTNGIAWALFFDRKPIRKDTLERWKEKLYREEGFDFPTWKVFEGAVGIKRMDNPRLFLGDKILAGTLAGMQDPMFLFGVHAALVSGKIAAMAVDDRAGAYELFSGVTAAFKYSWLMRGFVEGQPLAMRRQALRAFFSLQNRFPAAFQGIMFALIPGFNKL